jgi:GH15 family glucan-1,4-alpha-glucosidase
MGRSVMLSNGHMLVGLNDSGLVHDFYYPYVGLDNLTTSRSIHHNIGVWVNGKFSWIDDGSWDISTDFEEDALISTISMFSKTFQLELLFKDFVDSDYNAFCRYITINNKSGENIEVRLFLHQAFQISRAGRGDTALYVPSGNYILDYKGWCSLLIYAQNEAGQPFDQFAVGNYGIEDKEGTFRDAEDGVLSNNLVEHGGVDSVLRCSGNLPSNNSTTVSYWVVAAESQLDTEKVHESLVSDGLPKRLDATRQHWREWLNTANEKLDKIDDKYKKLTKKSLLVIKSHIDRHGGIIASCDSSIYNYGRDYYSYVWPRDGGLSMIPLITLGYTNEPKGFFDFCADTIHPNGYMMHKYQPDRAPGSTWHPLLHKHHPELAIQEDETATVLYAIGHYLKASGDTDYIKSIYPRLVKPAADFISGYRDQVTGLPHASYDLWEERFATHTYTTGITIAGLKMASYIAKELGNNEDSRRWGDSASQISSNIGKLFNNDLGFFRKSLLMLPDNNLEFNDTLDVSSGYGMLFVDNSEELTDKTFSVLEKKLLNSSPSGGIARYEHDAYFLDNEKYLGNPWIVCSLWMAQYYIKKQQMDKAHELLSWSIGHASQSGMFSEQVDPDDGEQVGVSPLVWSHSTFIDTILMLSGITS